MTKKRAATQFQPGNQLALGKGRPKGRRNTLSADFISDLVNEWREHGKQVLSIVRAEEPATLLKVIASIIPKELEINHNKLAEISDEQLAFLKSILGSRLADARGDRDGEDPTLN